MFEAQSPPPDGAAAPATVSPVSVLVREGFTEHEALRLLETRDQVQAGRLNEETLDYTRLAFARWLYQQGHTGEWREA